MVAKKDCCWIIFVPIVIVILLCALLINYIKRDWCNLAINAGDCQYYEEDEYCYCIDTFKYKNVTGQNIYESAQTQVNGQLNGRLAAPDQNDFAIWLAKRMFFYGSETAVIALRKFSSKWKWIKGSIEEEAVVIMWRPDFPPNPEHKQGILTVETLTENVHEDIFIYYNYDHYYDNDDSMKL